jgi:hypothetical protein
MSLVLDILGMCGVVNRFVSSTSLTWTLLGAGGMERVAGDGDSGLGG